MTDFSQEHILDNFKRYFHIQKEKYPDAYADDAEAFIEKLQRGVCSGLSAVWTLFMSRGTGSAFIEKLQNLADWDGRPDTLTDELSGNFEEAFSWANFVQHNANTTGMDSATDHEILKYLSVIAEHDLEQNLNISCNTTKAQMKKLLKNILHDGTSIRLSTANHIMAIYKQGDQYFFYDPNHSDGIVKGSLQEITNSAFIAAAKVGAYKEVGSTIPLNFITYEKTDIINERKLSSSELEDIQKRIGQFENPYSSAGKLPAVFFPYTHNDFEGIIYQLNNTRINLFRNSKMIDGAGKIVTLRLIYKILLKKNIFNIKQLIEIINKSVPGSGNEKYNFLIEAAPLLNTYNPSDIKQIIDAVHLPPQLIGKLYIYSASHYLPVLLLGMPPPNPALARAAIRHAINMDDDDSIDSVMQCSTWEPNHMVKGFPSLHLCRFDPDKYITLVQNGANQYLRDEKERLAIDFFIAAKHQKGNIEDFQDMLSSCISDFDSSTAGEDTKKMLNDLIAVSLLSNCFKKNNMILKVLSSNLDEMPFSRQKKLFTQMLNSGIDKPVIEKIITYNSGHTRTLQAIENALNATDKIDDISTSCKGIIKLTHAKPEVTTKRPKAFKFSISPKGNDKETPTILNAKPHHPASAPPTITRKKQTRN